MTCETARDMLCRRARGERLRRRETRALNAHLKTCRTCGAEARFEALIAETVARQPVVQPSPSFAENVLAALPDPQPSPLPMPSLRSLWGWAVGGGAVAAALSWAVWVLREQWLGWLFTAEMSATAKATTFLYQMQNSIAGAHFPPLSLAVAALIAFIAWRATALAEPGR